MSLRRSSKYGVALAPTARERNDNSISDSSRFAGRRWGWRRRGSGPSRGGRAVRYLLTEVGVSDLDAHQREYVPVVQASIKAAGGRPIAGGQNIIVLEGPSPGARVAINQFDSRDAVQAWRNSDQYKEAGKYAKFRSFAVEGLPQ